MDDRLEERLRLQLARWRDDLVNVSRTNRLLYFRHTKSASLELLEPTSAALLSRFAGPTTRNFWQFHFPPPIAEDEPARAPGRREGELLVKDKTGPELNSALRLLERKTTQEFVDKGLWTLYLGLGALRWVDPDDEKTVESPLLLVPVTFSRVSLQEPFRLRRTDDDAVFNPALSIKMANSFGISLPTIDDQSDPDPEAICVAVRDAVRSRRGWSVVDRAVLTTFTFHKEAMYRDLLENEEAILGHPLMGFHRLDDLVRQAVAEPPAGQH